MGKGGMEGSYIRDFQVMDDSVLRHIEVIWVDYL